MNRSEAKRIAEACLNFRRRLESIESDGRIVIREEKTIEKEWGWAFFFASEKWLRTRDFNHMLLGPTTILVEKESGHTQLIGHIRAPLDESIARYEEKRGFFKEEPEGDT